MAFRIALGLSSAPSPGAKRAPKNFGITEVVKACTNRATRTRKRGAVGEELGRGKRREGNKSAKKYGMMEDSMTVVLILASA